MRDIIKLAADLDVDLLAIGARGHTALYERMIGSQADRIMQLAQCPVLVAKLPAAEVAGTTSSASASLRQGPIHWLRVAKFGALSSLRQEGASAEQKRNSDARNQG